MNWLPHDSAGWALALSVAALILMYPMNLVANLSTPRLLDWWSSRSRNALEGRRNDLLSEQTDLKDVPTIDAATDLILWNLRGVLLAIGLSSHVVLTSFCLVLMWYAPNSGWRNTIPWSIVFGFLIINFVFQRFALSRTRRRNNRVSPKYRSRLEDELKDIEAKLANWDS